MALLDWVVVALLVLSVLIGAWRGLLFEVLSLVGWVAAFFMAQWFSPAVANWLPVGAPDAVWRYAVAFVLIFIGVAFAVGLVASLVRRLVTVVGLRPVDRTLGAVFGLARGVLALLVAAVVVHLFVLADSAWWRESARATAMDAGLQDGEPALPERMASYLP